MNDSADWSRLGPFVAAMYTVTAHEMEKALDECNETKVVGGREEPCRIKDSEHMPLISFPWLFPSELGKIATGGSSRRDRPNGVQSQHHQKKHVRPAQAEEADIGAVETETGTTLYGELLDLDFSLPALQMSDPTPVFSLPIGDFVIESRRAEDSVSGDPLRTGFGDGLMDAGSSA